MKNFFFAILLLTTLLQGLTDEIKYPPIKAVLNRPNIDHKFQDLPKTCVLNENKYFLPKSLNPIHYSLSLYPTLEPHFSANGFVSILLKVDQPTTCVVINSEDLSFNENTVSLNGTKPSSIKFVKETLQAIINFDQTLEQGKYYILGINFAGNVRNDLRGFYRASYQHEGKTKWLAVTQFEAIAARTAFPCYDEPRFRSTFDFNVFLAAAQKNLDIYANMDVKKLTRNGDERLYQFRTTPNMPSYLFAFALGEFEEISKVGPNNVVFRIVTTRGLKEEGHFALDVAVRCTDWFNKFFNIQYDLPKMDLIAIPEFAGGAMENWGLITFRNSALLRNNQTNQNDIERIASIVVHEIAHMWTGNLVTIQWWNELFLKEGWATFFATHTTDILFPDWKLWEKNQRAALKMLLSDSLSASPALYQNVFTPAEVNSMFNLISYNKGGAFYRMLAEFVGPTVFQNWMRDYQKVYNYQSITRTNLFSSLIKFATSIQMNDLLSWSDKAGYPVLNIEKSGNQFVLNQERFYSEIVQQPDNRTWWVPVTIQQSNGQIDKLVFSSKKSQPFTISGNWFKINKNQAGLYRVNYLPEQWNNIIKEIHGGNNKLSENDILGLVDDGFALSGASLCKINIPLEMSKASSKEKSNPIIATVLENLKEISNRIRAKPREVQDKFNRFVRSFLSPSYTRLGWTRKPEDTQDDIANRILVLQDSIHYEDVNVIRQAEQRYRNNDIPNDLKQLIYDTVVKYGSDQTFEEILKKFNDSQNPSEKYLLLQSLSQVSKESLMKTVLNLLLSDNVRTQDGAFIFNYMISNNPKSTFVIWNFFTENFDKIRQKYTQEIIDQRFIALITSQFDTQEMHDQVREFLKSRTGSPNLPLALSNILKRKRFIDTIYNDLVQYLK